MTPSDALTAPRLAPLRPGLLPRLVIPALGLATVAMFAVLAARDPGLYRDLFSAWGIAPYWPPFIDLHAELSSVICYQYGIDVFQANPCDVLGRPYVYSPLILVGLAPFHVTYDWIRPGGFLLVGLFLLALGSLPTPRGARAWTLTLLASFSTMTLFALERLNGDVVIFLLAVAAGHAASRRAGRPFAYGITLLAALLKFYPAAMLVIALRERRPARLLAVFGIAAAAIGAMIACYHDELLAAMRHVPAGPYFTDLFGAKNLPDGLAALLAPAFGANFFAGGSIVLMSWPIWIVLLLACGHRAFRLAGDPAVGRRFAALPPLETILLLLGAAAILCCFFGAQNVGYRGIFFLLVLPGLLLLARAPAPPERLHAGLCAALIAFLMWGEMFREAIDHIAVRNHVLAAASPLRVAFWFGRELAWWYVVATLAGLVLSFAVSSELGAGLLNRVRPRRLEARA